MFSEIRSDLDFKMMIEGLWEVLTAPVRRARSRRRSIDGIELLEPRIVLAQEPNNSLLTADPFPDPSTRVPGSNTLTVEDEITQQDTQDYYRLIAVGPGDLRFDLHAINVGDNLQGDLNIAVYNQRGVLMAGIVNHTGVADESFTAHLQFNGEQTLFVRIYAGIKNAASSYALDAVYLTAGFGHINVAFNDADDPTLNPNNDSALSAFMVGNVAKGTFVAIPGHLGTSGDKDDYFRFRAADSLPRNVSVTLLGSTQSKDMDLEILNSSGTRVALIKNSGSLPDKWTQKVPAGSVYYIHVLMKKLFATEQAYSLSILY